jgi:hypothetical protein
MLGQAGGIAFGAENACVSYLATAATRWRRFLGPAVFGLLLLAGSQVGNGPVGAFAFALLMVALVLTVAVHRSLGPDAGSDRSRGSLRTPVQVGVAVLVVVVAGGVAMFVVSTSLAAVAPALVGDGSLLVRLSLVVFAFAPCLSLGFRCGRWWAFSGAASLVPAVGICVVLAGPHSWSALGLLVWIVGATGLPLAVGSLQRRLTPTNVRATPVARSTAAVFAAPPAEAVVHGRR